MDVRQIAAAVGAPSESWTYSQYGRVGRQLAEAVGLSVHDLDGIWTRAIGRGRRDSLNNLVHWVMHRALAETVRGMKWSVGTRKQHLRDAEMRRMTQAARRHSRATPQTAKAEGQREMPGPAAFTQYWRNSTWDSCERSRLAHTASSQFRKRQVSPGDAIYVVTLRHGKLYVGARLVVKVVLSRKAAQQELGTSDLWEASDHALALRATRFRDDIRVPDSVARALRFEGGKALAFREPRRIDSQALRGVRRLTTRSAQMLDVLLGAPITRADDDIDLDAERSTGSTSRQGTLIGPTIRNVEVEARRGQDLFRRNLNRLEGRCRVTGVTAKSHLQACHIKPWEVSTEQERIDGHNGLLLSPHAHHLFDEGFITFSPSGSLRVSADLSPQVLAAWGINTDAKATPFSLRQRRYLAYHRRFVFERWRKEPTSA